MILRLSKLQRVTFYDDEILHFIIELNNNNVFHNRTE